MTHLKIKFNPFAKAFQDIREKPSGSHYSSSLSVSDSLERRMSSSKNLSDSHSGGTSSSGALTMSSSCLPAHYETSPRDTGGFSGVEAPESIPSIASPSRSLHLYASGNGNENGSETAPTNITGSFVSSVPPIYHHRSSSAIYDDAIANVYGTSGDCHASKVVGGVDNGQYGSALSLPHQLTHSSLSSSSSSSSSAVISAPLQSSYLPTVGYSGLANNYHHPHSPYHSHHPHHHHRQTSPYSSLGEVPPTNNNSGDHSFADYSHYLLNSATSSTSSHYHPYHHAASHPSFAHYAPTANALYSPGATQFSLGTSTHHYLPPPLVTSPKIVDEQLKEKEEGDHHGQQYLQQQQQTSPVGRTSGSLTRFFTFPASISSSSLSTSSPTHQTTESSSSVDHANNDCSPPSADCSASNRLAAPSMPGSYFYSNFRSTYGVSNTPVLSTAEYDYHSASMYHHYGHRTATEPLAPNPISIKEDYQQNDDEGINKRDDDDELHLEKGSLKRPLEEENKKTVKASLNEHKRSKVNGISNANKAIKCKLEIEDNSDQTVIL